ncbi:hypothetical protein ACLB2K_053158 [Fragaria x ananassa]
MKSMGIDEREVEFGISTLKNQLFELHDMYKDNVVHVVPTSSINSNLPTSSDFVILPNDEDEDFAEVVLKKAKTTTSTSSASSFDLHYYLDMPTLEVSNGLEFNILGWWRSHEEVYPVLSLIARDLLSVPPSTVASEAIFIFIIRYTKFNFSFINTHTFRVVSEKRASLSPSTIQALICLKDWKLVDARQQDKEQDELRAKEEEIAKRARPEYMIALERPNANMDEVEQIAD